MFLRFDTLPQTRLIGFMHECSFNSLSTAELWSDFMKRKHEIQNPLGTELYSLEVYPDDFFVAFTPERLFQKWAALRVDATSSIPNDMLELIVPAGAYAVFLHRGPASDGPKTYNHIFREWLPASGRQLDPRPHLAIMDHRYKHNAADSEEEIWVPVLDSQV